MYKFVSTKIYWPEKRKVLKRKKDFKEIYLNYAAKKAAEQASRCSQCGIPFCQVHCPLHNNIPDWLKLTAEDRLKEAYEMSSSTNNMPEVCGRICPQDKLCEGNCVIEKAGHGTVTIGSIEKYITDSAWKNNWVKPIKVKYELESSIGIIGAGPAGLSAAEMLRIKGYQVTVYDRYDRIGGLLIYGIPNFKLEKEIVIRRTKRLIKGGIKFKLNCNIGKDISFSEVRKNHDAVLIATGTYQAKKTGIMGGEFENIIPALQYLTASNKNGLGETVEEFISGKLNAKNKNVVVIGCGDTAMDCVRTAVRQKASSVKCLYRRDRNNIPGSQREVSNAVEEGVDFHWLTSPKKYIGEKEVEFINVAKMKLGKIDHTGRVATKIIKGKQQNIATDMIIEAVGFNPENIRKLFNCYSLSLSQNSLIKVNNYRTNLENVFAAGDIIRGASLVVWAIKDGREAANSIDQYIKSVKLVQNSVNFSKAS